MHGRGSAVGPPSVESAQGHRSPLGDTIGDHIANRALHLPNGRAIVRAMDYDSPLNCVPPTVTSMTRSRVLMYVFLMFVILTGPKGDLAQSTPALATPSGVVFLTKLSDPVYPQIARTAHISGDVELMLVVRQDGSIESVEVVSGPPLLQKAALFSAQHSQFECHGCSTEPSPHRLVYTFQLVDPGCCMEKTRKISETGLTHTYPQVTHSQDRVTLVDQPVCICDLPAQIGKVRSLKCLFLWRCAIDRW